MADVRRPTDERAGYPPRRLTAAVLAIGAIALGALGVVAIVETASRAITSTSPVATTVVGEYTEERLVADRRGSRYAPFRYVIVELPDGTAADVRSDDLDVGADATVYRSDSGAVFETPPSAPGPIEWAVCASAVAGALALGVGSVRAMRRPTRS
ncbi:hypothetical protein GCM10017608_31970 [Agromyces luteolus]|uniref:DUF3592 domain-containing protein n=1 Tax=Agromyces luteolus TaxID=88373 RepID=A0A7C9LY58_9MICO|nr:hypothetical protein [Agromyces luteolus]MUN06573.1 hypothetical protein [Agromyces luteolus]GLK29261.1 hypothetical protein GCM10017608_31970 [Agromyces luteolus]